MIDTRTLRIAQVAPVIRAVPPADEGGTERIVAELADALIDLGHDVTLFAPAGSHTRARIVEGPPSLEALTAAHGTVPPGTPAVLEAALLETLRPMLDQFDIVHCHGEFFHAALLGAGRPTSLTTLHWRTDELDRRLFFECFADLPVAAISASQAAHVPAANLAGIVPHGLDGARFGAGPPNAGDDLLFIGRMTDQKRPDLAIEIARAAHRRIRLAGGIDPGNPYYFAHHVEKRLGADAEYLGAIGEADKIARLHEAAALLLPIDWPEPFGLVMIEAMACGTPVIAWNRGAAPEIVEHGVTGFIVDSIAEAVEALEWVSGLDRDRIRGVFDQRFSAKRMAENYVALYRRQLARRTG
ncbi:glycosyltransferase family 4 protein [Salinisphaera sp. T31B1]|uniref:glycosyltransferase family 4 protein n=1 Tax=Salinisphaera sp. T31B1 TaxID=727963 RepID=UPI0033423A06